MLNRKLFILSICSFFFCTVNVLQAQNVGIGNSNPQNTLHISPTVNGDHPLRIDGLNLSGASDTSIMMLNLNSGLVKYMNPDNLKDLLKINSAVENGIYLDPISKRTKLGGILTENTTIEISDYEFVFDLISNGDFYVHDDGDEVFRVHDNGRVSVGGAEDGGAFNVKGFSFFMNDVIQKNGTILSPNILRLYGQGNTGIIDQYDGGPVVNKFHAAGPSYITGGSLGIGTQIPSQALDVEGSVRIADLSGAGSRMVVTDANGVLSSQSIPSVSGNITNITAGDGLSGGGSSGSVNLDLNVNNGLMIDPVSNHVQLGGALIQSTTIHHGNESMNFNINGVGSFNVQDNGQNKFSVNSQGRVTIGGPEHAGALNVSGRSYFSDEIYLRDASVQTGNNLFRLYDDTGSGIMDMYNNGILRNRIDSDGNSFILGGNFGVGVMNPLEDFHVDGDIFVSNGSIRSGNLVFLPIPSISELELALDDKSYGLGIYNYNTSESVVGGIRVRVDTEDRLAHGVASLVGSTGNHNSIGIQGIGDSDGGQAYGGTFQGRILFVSGSPGTNPTEVYGIRADASPNPLANPNYAGYFVGDVYSTGLYLPSHSGLKKNVSKSKPALRKLLELKVQEYEYKTKELNHMILPKGRQTGIMSSEIKKAFPLLVKYSIHHDLSFDQEGLLNENAKEDVEFESVNYVGLIPHMIKGMQEQHQIIQQKDNEVVELKNLVSELSHDLDLLKAELKEIKNLIKHNTIVPAALDKKN